MRYFKKIFFWRFIIVITFSLTSLLGTTNNLFLKARKETNSVGKCMQYTHSFETIVRNKIKIDTTKDLPEFIKACRNANMFSKPINVLLPYVKEHPKPSIYLSIVKLLKDYGALVDASNLAKKSIEIYPHNEKLVKEAMILLPRIDKKEAETFAKSILKKNMKSISILLILGNFYLQDKKFYQASQIYEKILDIDKSNKEAIDSITKLTNYGLHIGDTLYFPTKSQFFISNSLWDREQGDAVFVTNISKKNIHVAAEKFVNKIIPNAKETKKYFVKNDNINKRETSFVYAAFLMPQFNGKKVVYTQKFSTAALAFELKNTKILLSISRSQMSRDELYTYLNKIMKRFISTQGLNEVSK